MNRLLACLLPLVCATALAATSQDEIRRAVQAGQVKPLSDILHLVQQRTPGRVLDVELEQGPQGQRWYEIKLLTPQQQRIELYVDAVTGREIKKPEHSTGRLLPMAQVLRQVQSQHSGLIVKADLEEERGERPVYEIELLSTDGRDIALRVDAITGQVLRKGRFDPALHATFVALPPLLEALAQRFQAHISEVELKRGGQPPWLYEVEMRLPNGRTQEVWVDAQTGRTLQPHEIR